MVSGARHARSRHSWLLLALAACIAGCDSRASTSRQIDATLVAPQQSEEPAREANFTILFVGNSHTWNHAIPELVRRMIEFQNPAQSVRTSLISVGWLEQTATDPAARNELLSRNWDLLILQGQKISVSGKFEYSREEGVALAKLARSRGTRVLYFAEWGLKDVAGDGQRIETIYREMAEEAGAEVIPIGKAWDCALEVNRDLPLHEPDGNHQSAMGAYLTAATMFGRITGKDATTLAGFGLPELNRKDQSILLEAASKAVFRDDR